MFPASVEYSTTKLNNGFYREIHRRQKNKTDGIVLHMPFAAELYHNDIRQIDIFPECLDLIVTSPPYNLGIEYASSKDEYDYAQYLRFSEYWLWKCFCWSKHTGRLCLNIPLDKNKGGRQSVGADLTTIAQKVGWKYQSTIVWNERNISRRTAWGSWMSASAPCVIAPVELIVVFYKGDWKKAHKGISDIKKEDFIAWTNGLWTFNGESKKRIGHPAPFPRELPRRCIQLFSYVGDTVCDPFSGSGTTMIESYLLGRKFVGVDIDSRYCELAKKRFLETIKKEKGGE